MTVDVEAAFPELSDIEDDDLRASVREAWMLACEETGVEDLHAVPWFPPSQLAHGIEDESLVDHVRDVVDGCRALADVLETRRDPGLDRDLLTAAALVHDVSKLHEFDGMTATPVADLLGHPYFGVYTVTAAGLPVECAHVVLSHTPRTNVEPAFLEAEIVRRVDEVAATAIRAEGVDDLRDA